jgi:hypothetical protein
VVLGWLNRGHGGPPLRKQKKFFGSFFQKRTLPFLH